MNFDYVYTLIFVLSVPAIWQVIIFCYILQRGLLQLVLRNLQGFPLRLVNVCRVFQTCCFVDRGKFPNLPCSLELPLGTGL